jgi:hypothetical protein
MNGPLRLLILIAGFVVLYLPILVLEIASPLHWFWFGAEMGCLCFYFTIWGTGLAKGWWKT